MFHLKEQAAFSKHFTKPMCFSKIAQILLIHIPIYGISIIINNTYSLRLKLVATFDSKMLSQITCDIWFENLVPI